MRKSILFLLSFMLVAGIAFNAQALSWSYGGHDYFLVERKQVSWDAALQDVENNHKGYTLAAITSPGEQAYLQSVLNKQRISGEYWLGGFQEANSEVWHWTDPHASWGYTNWAPGEANDHYGDFSEQHLAVWDKYEENAWLWNDEGNLRNINGYIAESVSVTEPSTVMLIGFALLGVAGLNRRKFR